MDALLAVFAFKGHGVGYYINRCNMISHGFGSFAKLLIELTQVMST